MEEFFQDRSDIYISGDTAVRYDPEQKKNRNFRGPDFYVIKNVSKRFRESWVTWEENSVTPNFVLELASRTTVHVDFGTKKNIYEQILKTPEYVIYNPMTEKLSGWRLTSGYYKPIKPNENGWLWSEELGLWLGIVEHNFLRAPGLLKTPRFFDKSGQLLLTGKEAEARQKEIEARRADCAEKRAEAETKARRQAEAEIARLQALLNSST